MLDLITTARLTLRPFASDDIDAAHAWFSDDSVMEYTPTGPDKSIDETRRRIAGYQEHQSRHGFSKWIVIERSTGQPIGDSGLLVLKDEGFVDLGFRFATSSWGKGFATEVGRAWLKAAFEMHGLEALGAFVHPQNVASLRVLEKLGFARLRAGTAMGMEAVFFSFEKMAGSLE